MTEQGEEEPPVDEIKEDDVAIPTVEVTAAEDTASVATTEIVDVPNDGQDETKHEENGQEQTDIIPHVIEPAGDQDEHKIEPDHADAGIANEEQTSETDPHHEQDIQPTTVGESEDKTIGENVPIAVDEDQLHLETEPRTSQPEAAEPGVTDRVNEGLESITTHEKGEETIEDLPHSAEDQPHSADNEPHSAEDQPHSAEDQPRTEQELAASADPQTLVDATSVGRQSQAQPQLKTEKEATAGENVQPEAEKIPLLPKSKELLEWEKIERDMAKEAAAEALAAGIAEKAPEVICNIKSPENLNAESFFKSLKSLQMYLQPSEKTPSTYVASKKIQQIVTSMRSDMTCLREFCEATQAQMETVREPIKVITDQILHAIPKVATAGEADQTPATLDAELKQKTAHSQLAMINEALLSGMKLVAQTESAVADAQMAVVEAIELAKRVQAEAEQRLKDEMEAKRLLIEAEKAEVARKKKEEELRIAQALIDAEMLKKRAESADKEIKPVVLPIETAYEFDNGIGCIFYSEMLSEKMIKCTSVDLTEAAFEYIDNEELISHIVRLEPINELTTIRSDLKIAIPHGLTRLQAAIREPFIKMQVEHPDGPWKELVTNDVIIEGFRDIKFAEVSAIKTFGTFAVVSRFKRDVIKMKKRGGTSMSKIDERVEFVYDPGSFNVREKAVLQMQPVDNTTITELRRSLDVAKGLLCSTAVFRMTWRNTNFESPVTVTMILPPNPVAARKLAAERSAKDGKRSKTLIAIGEEGMGDDSGKKKEKPTETEEISMEEIIIHEEEEHEAPRSSNIVPGEEQPEQPEEAQEVVEKVTFEGDQLDQEIADEKAFAESHKKKKSKKDEESEERKALWRTPVKWYMGKYGKDVEDERDQLFLVRHNAKKGRWTIEPYRIDVGKFDKIFVELQEPMEAFVVFRVSMSVMERDVEKIADALESILARRVVRFIVKQQFNDPCEVIVCIAPIVKMERVLKRLQDEEYTDGPEMSGEFLVRDGDRLTLVFRGNIVCEDNAASLMKVFTTNLDTKFKLRINANDVYVQKSYDVYRGFVQLRHVYQVLIKPEEPKKKDAKTIAAEKAAALLAAKRAADEQEQKEGEDASSATPGGEDDGKGATAETTAGDAKTTPASDGENKAAAATAEAAVAEVEEPPAPLYETIEELLAESLITFPKDSIALTSTVPKKAPITYIPLNDVITHEILKKLAETVSIQETDWRTVLDELNIKRNIQTVIRRRGDLKSLKQAQVRYETLLQWVKKLEKGTDKWELLSNALNASQNPDVTKLLSNIIAGKPELGRFSRLPELSPEEEELRQKKLKEAQLEEDILKEQEGKGPLKLQLRIKKAAFNT